MRPNTVSTLALSTAVFALVAASPAAAKIECRENFQVTKKNGLISTPYCEDQQIARVARSYGYNVSDAEVHNNPNTKVYLLPDHRQRQPAEGVVRRLLRTERIPLVGTAGLPGSARQ